MGEIRRLLLLLYRMINAARRFKVRRQMKADALFIAERSHGGQTLLRKAKTDEKQKNRNHCSSGWIEGAVLTCVWVQFQLI